MKEEKNDTYDITGESIGKLRKNGFEVLYMLDSIDEYRAQQLKELDGEKLKSAATQGWNLEDEDEKTKLEKLNAEFEPLTKLMKEVLGDKVERVVVSSRIVDPLCVLTTSEYGWSANMESIMKAQAMRDNSMTSYMVSKRTMKVNPKDSIVTELKRNAGADKSDKTVKDLNWLLVTSGFNLDEPTQLAGRHRMIKLGLSINDDSEGLCDDDDSPPLEEVRSTADAASKMEEASPFFEILRRKGLEVICMLDPIDEYRAPQLTESDCDKLKRGTKEGSNLEDEDEKKQLEEPRAKFELLTKLLKEVLGDKVEKVVVSSRIADSPCMLRTSAYEWSANMKSIMKAQAMRENSMTSYTVPHDGAAKKASADKSDKPVKDLIWLHFTASLLTSSFNLDEPTQFAGRIHRIIKLGLSIDDDDDDRGFGR